MVSLKQIAEKTGYSLGTIDRALHNRGRISEKTRKHVLQVAAMLGYTPNLHARNLKLSKTYSFGILLPLPEQDGGYWTMMVKGIEQAIEQTIQFAVKPLYFFYDKYSEQSIREQINAALIEKVDGYIIAPLQSKIFQDMLPLFPIERPYLFVDSSIEDTTCLTFIGQNAYESGKTAARLMFNTANANGSIAAVKPMPADEHIRQRIQGFVDFYSNKGIDIHVFDFYIDTPIPEFVNTIKNKLADLKGIFVSNAMVSLISRELKIEKEITLIGYDLISENKKELEAENIDYLLCQMTERQGFEALQTLLSFLTEKRKVPAVQWMPIDIITKENLPYYFG